MSDRSGWVVTLTLAAMVACTAEKPPQKTPPRPQRNADEATSSAPVERPSEDAASAPEAGTEVAALEESDEPAPMTEEASGAEALAETGEPAAQAVAPVTRAEQAGQGESYWRNRLAAAQAAVAAAEAKLDRLEKQKASVAADDAWSNQQGLADCRIERKPAESMREYAERNARETKACQDRWGTQAHKLDAPIAAARQELEAARAALDAVPEEARRAGALPGWLR